MDSYPKNGIKWPYPKNGIKSPGQEKPQPCPVCGATPKKKYDRYMPYEHPLPSNDEDSPCMFDGLEIYPEDIAQWNLLEVRKQAVR